MLYTAKYRCIPSPITPQKNANFDLLRQVPLHPAATSTTKNHHFWFMPLSAAAGSSPKYANFVLCRVALINAVKNTQKNRQF
ncbi:MAG: hypothetical protein Q8M15_14560 [Bacteroidota bacterium]|nr:hypothetical protein [Bacteroidota bacterium]